ncbi:MAG: hypothetical protein ACYSUY_06330 [Planctomycetota bacterium]
MEKNMNEFLTEIILAARQKGTESWMKILFPVLLALFWVISGILKAKSKKAENEKAEGKQLGVKPGVKPSEGTTKEGPFQKIRRAIEAEVEKQRQLQTQQAQRKVVRPQPAARKVVPKTESATRISASKPAVEAGLAQPIQQIESGIQELPEFTVKTIKKLKDKRIGAPSEIPQAKHLAEILSDYSDPDELKRAILHYEILGKPLALRGSSGSVIGL